MKKFFKKIRIYLSVVLIFLALTAFFYLAFVYFYQDKFFPGVKIAGLDVGGKKVIETERYFADEFNRKKEAPLNINYQEQTFAINLKSAQPEINLKETVSKAYLYGHTKNIFADIPQQFQGLIFGANFPFSLIFGAENNFNQQVSAIGGKVNKEATPAELIIKDGVIITPSQNGLILDNKLLAKQIVSFLDFSGEKPNTLPVKTVVPFLTTEKAEKFKQVLEKVKASPIKLHFNDKTWSIDQPTLYSLLDFNKPENKIIIANKDLITDDTLLKSIVGSGSDSLLDEISLYNFLKTLSLEINQPLKEATFVFDESINRVNEFQPGQDGRELDIKASSKLISDAVGSGDFSEINLPVNITYPKTTAGDVNGYGIRELLGTGTSSFVDSIPNRVFNIGLASSRTQGVLVPPGETFSFNNAVGEISQATGYKQAYVIKEGKTVLDDGGGVCQVSTTLFRAALNAGLPIVERTAHAYRVGFYEQGGSPPGFDATVFPPSVDFKFKNDTPNYILIQNKMVGTTLTFQIYGTSDGRIATVGKPVILNTTPPPPELRKDDPTLPKGVEKEVEHAITGMNIQFKRTVTRNGETIIDEVIRSNFRPWQKVIMVGTM